ncbi:enhanced serine sensitivity protein SseB C-terminal domain-containing protein [Aurantivibrio infirmus]
MRIEKQVLSESKSLDLSIPPDGFDHDFLSATTKICNEMEQLEEAYVLLKNNANQENIFFAFLFDPRYELDSDGLISILLTKILELFTDEVSIDVICLNGKKNLIENLKSITPPFYRAD